MTTDHTAPAWDGDIDTLDATQLHDRVQALGLRIGQIHTVWTGDDWRPANHVELERNQHDHLVELLCAALQLWGQKFLDPALLARLDVAS